MHQIIVELSYGHRNYRKYLFEDHSLSFVSLSLALFLSLARLANDVTTLDRITSLLAQ